MNTTLFTLLVSCSLGSTPLPDRNPDQVGMDAARLSRIDQAVVRAIDRGTVPGAVVLVARNGGVVYAKAFGKRSVEPTSEPMTRDTIFDMASLTKPLATATSAMILLERSQLRLTDSLGRLLKGFSPGGKGVITVEHLLRHRAGLIADNSIADYAEGPKRAWENLAALKTSHSPGERFLYSDVGFLLLGKIVEEVSGLSLDRFSAAEIFEPLGMTSTRFLPLNQPVDQSILARIAPTEREGEEVLRGKVHDPRARALGGVAGHAGLFSTADDIALQAQMLLDGGRARDGRRVLAPATIQLMIDTGDTPANQRRGLGWDVSTGFSAPRGSLFGASSFGHTGFTGTSLWIDPETRCFVIILTSRLHPKGNANLSSLRSEIATLVAGSIVDTPIEARPRVDATPLAAASRPRPRSRVLNGIDVLIQHEFRELKGQRVGLVTNHTGRSRDGRSTIDVLHQAPDVKLIRLFSPEHGIRGEVDREVNDDVDAKTGLPIKSLYGKSRKPDQESLADLDGLVVDLQDIGTRFYTYISTLGNVLEAAKQAGKVVWVLDRPNPIGGTEVAGPLNDPNLLSFIAYHPLPVRHGMTIGEIARLFNTERKVQADLRVIACEGWTRGQFFDQTGLVWVNPSPNMRSLTEALLYPGIGLLEATNLATGRGTDTPFERIGAPWIDPAAFAAALNQKNLPGLRFVPIRFTPKERQYAGKECGGVYLIIDDWSRFEPIVTGLTIANTLKSLHPKQWESEKLLTLLADKAVFDGVQAGMSVPELQDLWRDELERFLSVREAYLLYPR